MSASFDFQALAGRARQDQPDAPLFSLVEAFEDRSAAYRGSRGEASLIAAAMGACRAGDTLAAFTPRTVEGLKAKLRAAERMMWKSPGSALLQSALNDALAWLEANPTPPPPPAKPRRKAR